MGPKRRRNRLTTAIPHGPQRGASARVGATSYLLALSRPSSIDLLPRKDRLSSDSTSSAVTASTRPARAFRSQPERRAPLEADELPPDILALLLSCGQALRKTDLHKVQGLLGNPPAPGGSAM